MGDNDPLDWLPEKQRSIVAAVIDCRRLKRKNGAPKDTILNSIR